MDKYINHITNNYLNYENKEKCSITPDTTYNIYYENANDNIYYTFYQEKIKIRKSISCDLPLCFRIAIDKDKVNETNYIDTLQKIQIRAEEVLLKLQTVDEYYGQGIQEYPNNSFIIDVFEHENKDKSKEYVPKCGKTHMIILLRKTDDNIQIYDPSNSDFSQRISKYFTENSKNKFSYSVIEHPSQKEFYKVKDKDHVGYSSYSEEFPLSRTCKDIAVKISFELGELQKQKYDKDKLSAGIFSQLSNMLKKIYFYDCACIREVQSTNNKIRKDAVNFIINSRKIMEIYYCASLIQIQKIKSMHPILQ